MKNIKVLFGYYKKMQDYTLNYNNSAYLLTSKEEVMTQKAFDIEYKDAHGNTLTKFLAVEIDGVVFAIQKVPQKVSIIEND